MHRPRQVREAVAVHDGADEALRYAGALLPRERTRSEDGRTASMRTLARLGRMEESGGARSTAIKVRIYFCAGQHPISERGSDRYLPCIPVLLIRANSRLDRISRSLRAEQIPLMWVLQKVGGRRARSAGPHVIPTTQSRPKLVSNVSTSTLPAPANNEVVSQICHLV